MISAITGLLARVDGGRIQIRSGAMLFEVLVPAVDGPELSALVGEELTLHTVFYLEGDARGGNMEPRLLGFVRPEDREFFNLFITVKGIGPKRALRALSMPVAEIASAIESRDTRFLVGLPEIGKRTAEQIVAELAGKTDKFILAGAKRGPSAMQSRRPAIEEDAIAGLMALGERRIDAEHLLDRVKQGNPDLKTTDALLREMLRVRSG